MKRSLFWLFLAVLLITVTLTPALAACNSQSSPTTPSTTTNPPTTTTAVSTTPTSVPPAPKPEIRIGIMGGITGTGKSAVIPMMEEIENVLKYTNEMENGIDGAKLAWKIVDNQGTPDGAITAYKELRDTFHPTVYFIIEDYLYAGIKDTIAEDKAVMLSTSSLSSALYVPPGRFFGLSLPTADGFAAYSKWVLTDWKKNHPDQSRPPKVGVLYWDMPSGLQWKVAEGWVKKQGVDIVGVSYPMTSIDLKTQFMQLRDAGVDYIWMNCITQQAALAIRDFGGLGLTGKIPFSFMEFVESAPLITLIGPGAKGYYQYRSEDPSTDGSQAAKLWSTIRKWAKNDDKWSDNRITITFKAALTAAVKQAAADVSWQKIDSEAIYNALNKLTVIDTWGNMKDFGYGPTKRIGPTYTKMVQYTADSVVAASDPIALPRVFEGIDK
jgi:ABC-type branched-subunit amino acid transport system substrate-binding protein